MQDHTLRGLISESALDGETYKSISSYLIDATLSHPLNSRIVREFDLMNGKSESSPGGIQMSRLHEKFADSFADSIGSNCTGAQTSILGFPQFSFSCCGRKPEECIFTAARVAKKMRFDIESRDNHGLTVSFTCGEIWLPVISHPRGNETDIPWNVISLSAVQSTLCSSFESLRDEAKDTPLCKSLESYSVGYETRVKIISGTVYISCHTELISLGSTLKRASLYLCP